MGYGPFGKPTTVSIERYQRLENDFNELLIEHKNLVEALEEHRTVMENTDIFTFMSRATIIYHIITMAKERLNKFIKA
jgi:hypothetical protein